MSECAFQKQLIDAFSAEHPASDGWRIYELSAALQLHCEIEYLPDFLRDVHPEKVQSERFVRDVRSSDLLETDMDAHRIQAGDDWDLHRNLDAYDWTGAFSLDWLGQPIHCLRFAVTRSSRCSAALCREVPRTPLNM